MKDGSLRKYKDSFMTGILEEIIGIKPDDLFARQEISEEGEVTGISFESLFIDPTRETIGKIDEDVERTYKSQVENIEKGTVNNKLVVVYRFTVPIPRNASSA